MDGSEKTEAKDASSASRRLTASLDLSFRGPTPQAATGWREGRWSDWTVRVGHRQYNLHAFTLARSSLFFESHMNVAQQTGQRSKESDLTAVIPEACYDAFEDALDFVYSDNQLGFQIPETKALLLLKISDILGMMKLFEACKARVQDAVQEYAPLLLEQFCRFYIPGTNDSEALQQVSHVSTKLIIGNFQQYLGQEQCREALLRLPTDVLSEILCADDLAISSEDVVFDFVMQYVEAARDRGNKLQDCDLIELWKCVRWQYIGSAKFTDFMETGKSSLLSPDALIQAFAARMEELEPEAGYKAERGAGKLLKRTVRPDDIPPPCSTDIDFCIHFGNSERFALGQPLRSEPTKIGDLVLRVLVFPCGTKTGVARGSLSVFLEAVPQPHWPSDWEFAQIKYSIVCFRWPGSQGERRLGKRKTDTWTFRATKLDRGWHDFLQPGEVQKYLSDHGFLLLRGSIEASCLTRTFLSNNELGAVQRETQGMASQAAVVGLAI